MAARKGSHCYVNGDQQTSMKQKHKRANDAKGKCENVFYEITNTSSILSTPRVLMGCWTQRQHQRKDPANEATE